MEKINESLRLQLVCNWYGTEDGTELHEVKDIIDCGLGDHDEAWINVSVDHDTASGCEKVHTG